MSINCSYCGNPALLVTGKVIYPSHPQLHSKKFWQCKPCNAYVGCHDRNKNLGLKGDEPLGRLADAELRKAKSKAHMAFDPKWKKGSMTRTEAYQWLAEKLGIANHTGECHIGMFDLFTCSRVVSWCVFNRDLNSVRYQSNALWPKGVCHNEYGNDISTDKHLTSEMAHGVCIGLNRDGFGGQKVHFPIKTWVSIVEA